MRGRLTYRVFDLLSRRRVIPTLDRMLERQTWDRAALKRDTERRLERLLQHAAERVPYYRELSRRIGPPSIATMPLLTKDTLLSAGSRLLADGLHLNLMRRAQSGGSTGTPVDIYLDRGTIDAQSAVVLRHQLWMGLDIICPHILMWGPPADVVSYGTFRGRLRGFILGRHFEHTHVLDEARASEIRERLRRECPPQVIGYSSALDLIADEASPLPSPPAAVVAAAEVLYPSQRRRIQNFFGAPLFERYGCNEFAAIAHQCRFGAIHVNSDRLLVEIVRLDGSPAEPGEIGEAVVTDLDNYGMPLIRYRLGDALEAGGACDCPLPFPTIAAIHGRLDDIVSTASGEQVSPRHISTALEPCGEIVEHQVAMMAGRPVRVDIRSRGRLDLSSASSVLSELLEEDMEARQVDRLLRWPSGKVRPVLRVENRS